MTPEVLIFVRDALGVGDVQGKRILEVGAYDVNGSAKPIVMEMQPETYTGLDVRPGPNVDVVADVCDGWPLSSAWQAAADGIICTEALEHIHDWRTAVTNMKAILKDGGWILLTTRGPGFPRHDFPSDYWRFTVRTMLDAFDDFHIDILKSDPTDPGVFLFAHKPVGWKAKDLSGIDAIPV